ncbi:MAG: HDOD domain-containing protein [Methylococcales bacterium]
MPITMNQLFDQIHSIPQIPEVVRTLITEFNNPNINFNIITKNIEKEQVISIKVLRLVNSAHFGLSKKIGTIQEAVLMLGMNQLRTLVITSGMVNAIPKIDGVNLKHFWEDSFRTATYAKWLAAETKQAPDLAFTAGLISDLGRILIHLGAPSAANEIEQHINNEHNRSELELSRLGFTSEAVCAELCRRWHFSADLINSIAQCGAPLKSAEVNKPACVVNIARYLSEAQQENLEPETILEAFPYAVAEKLDLTQSFITGKLPEILALESGLEGLSA